MTKSKAERKKNYIRIGAMVVAGGMAISLLLTVIIR